MASIQKKGSSYSVVYYHGGTQKWETFTDEKAAKDRKLEIEYEQNKGTFVPPANFMVSDLIERFIQTYGKKHWGHSAYPANIGLLNNYVLPYIGSLPMKKCTTRKMSEYFDELSESHAVQRTGHKTSPGLISDRTISDIFGLLNLAFGLAQDWGEIGKNPLIKSMKPKSKRGSRETWDEETAKRVCMLDKSIRLQLYFHLALGCTMRIGEISGLKEDCLFLNEDNDYENAHIRVEVQLKRIDRKAYETLLRKKDQIRFVFPEVYPNKKYKTVLVLKTPKTDSSVRTVNVPKTTAKLLSEWLKRKEELKNTLGTEYNDYGLVMSLDNGRPIESRIIGKELDEFIQKNSLKDVDFHSLRHTSTSVKLIITKGDIKGVQGDGGWVQSKMVTDTYAEIDDRRRQQNAILFDQHFYGGQTPDNFTENELEMLLQKLTQKPEMIEKVFSILKKAQVPSY